jgi:hypothetical protein
MALVLSISGLVAAATITAAGTAPVVDPAVTAAQTFVDVNGDGIDDTCQTGVLPNIVAAAAAQSAADLNGDGVISVSEAAVSGRTGGTNCNHGGYVSVVAHSFGQTCDGTELSDVSESSDASETDNSETVTTVTTDTTTTDTATITTTTDTTTCSTDSTLAAVTTTSETASTTTCTTTTSSTTDTTSSTTDTTTTDTAPNAHGKAVSAVAQSDAVGGKNCNHGGAVSEVAHQNHAARDAAKAARDARKLSKVHGKGHNH